MFTRVLSKTLAGCGATALLAIGAAPANAAIVSGSFAIDSADIVDLYSATFDGALIPCGGSPTAECTFFSGSPPAGRAITITPTGTGGGSLSVMFDDSTGEITEVTGMEILLPKLTLVIANLAGPTTIVADPAIGPNLTFIRSGLAAPSATTDADEGSGIGDASVFRHDDSPTIAADFATFTDIVDTCSGPLCALIGILSLDGVRYQLGGTVNALGGDALVLKAQSANNSIYTVNLTTAPVPVPAAGWLMIPAIGAVVARARRRRAA